MKWWHGFRWWWQVSRQRAWNAGFKKPRRITVEYDISNELHANAVEHLLDVVAGGEDKALPRHIDTPVGRWPMEMLAAERSKGDE